MTFTKLKTDLARVRAARHNRRELARELSDYTSVERIDLETLLDQYPAEQTADVRAALALAA
jgi:hypothetical protein